VDDDEHDHKKGRNLGGGDTGVLPPLNVDVGGARRWRRCCAMMMTIALSMVSTMYS
jgi:hypothetical protein